MNLQAETWAIQSDMSFSPLPFRQLSKTLPIEASGAQKKDFASLRLVAAD
jgi:hypothetical protein